MDKQALIIGIKEKFGSLSAFCRVVKMDRYELQKTFARKSLTPHEYTELNSLMLRKKPLPKNTYEKRLKKLIKAIKKAGGVYKFTEDNPRFIRRYVYFICSGKINKVTPRVQELFDHFKIE